MPQLITRDVTLTAGTIRITTRDPGTLLPAPTLRVSFKIERSTSKDHDKAEILIYNLSREHRSDLQQKKIACTLLAGYAGATFELFNGTLTFAQTVQDGTDWITKIQLADGIEKIKSSRVNIGLRGPVTSQQAFNAIISAMGLQPGNTAEKTGTSLRQSLTQFVNGLTMSGKAELQLDKLAKAFGYSWFVQGGALHLLGPNETLAGQVVSLRPGVGLIGSPQAGEKGVLKVRSLLQPGLLPGYKVHVESAQVKPADFKIEKATYLGDTWGTDWYADLEVKPIL